MVKLYHRTCTLVFVLLVLLAKTTLAQVATTYTFSQASNTYTPLVASYPSTPANIFSTSWDDDAYTGYTLPFAFFYNGTLYPAGTVIGVDTDAWLAFNPGTMTGQMGGGSWVSTSNSNGVYLFGSANNNGFAGMNADHWYQNFNSITGNLTANSNVVTGVSSLTNIRIGTRLTGNSRIADGTVVIAIGANQFTMSANASGTQANSSITPAASIFAMTRGTAPNRQFVVQWSQTKRYNGANNDNMSFQMILEEAPPQQLKVMYGTVSTNVAAGLLMQVGLRGASSADYNARTATSNWNASTAATANTQTVSLSSGNTPASGLTFIWTPACPALAAPGAVNGANPACPGSTTAYSIPAVAGASYYIWSYSGTGASFAATTATPSNNISFATNATGGTLSVTPANACVGAGTAANLAIAITSVAPASITYPSGGNYCISSAPVSVTQSGPAGGVYSVSPAGLSINASTGQITPATSSTGAYAITYTYTSNGCAALTTTANVNIQPNVSIVAIATPAAVCGSGNAQLTAIADGGGNYGVTAISHTTLSPSGAPTVLWNSNIDDAVSAAIALPFAFTYYGQSITQFAVSTNGFIEMLGVSGLSAPTQQTIPNAGTPNNIIALAWSDLEIDLTANPLAYIRYFVNGTAPNRIMVVEYNGLSFYTSSGTGNVTGQIRLFESDNHIEIHALVNDGGLNLSKTLGIENSTGTLALTAPGHNNVVWNATTPEAWSFNLNNYTYSWSPATFLSNTAIYNPVATGVNATTNYAVLVTNSLSGCSNTANVNLNYFNTQLLSSNNASRCGNGSLALTATANAGNTINWYNASSGGTVVGTGATFNTPSLSATTTYYVAAEAIGAGATVMVGSGASSAFDYDGIFYHLYGGSQTQFLVRASELTAAGLSAGNITQLGIRFASVNSMAYNGFAVSMMHTTNTDMSAGLNTGAFTAVYSAASVTPTVGINTYTLATAFNWDGASNIIIKLCWSNNNNGGTSNYAQVDGTAYVSCAYYRIDNQSAATICGGTTATSTVSSRPQFYFTGNTIQCSSARTAVTATVNPQPSALTMSPTSVNRCSADAATALSFTGGTYTNGTANAYTQGFEIFPPTDFNSSGAGAAPATNTTYYAEGIRSVRLTHNNNRTLATNNNQYTITNNINLSAVASATLSFKHICALEGAFSTLDAGYVQYSANGGGTWATFPTASYTGTGTLMTTVNGSPATGTVFSTLSYADWASQFTSNSSTPGTGPATALWKTETITIPAAALTNNFRIRFTITSDNSLQYYGWLLDDIKIIVPGTTAAPVTWAATTGLFTDAAASVNYTGTAATTVYANPSATTTYTATATAAGGCTATNTVTVTVRPAYTWLGNTANWSDVGNWCPAVPTSSNDVVINTGVPFMPILSSGTGSVRNITMGSNATLAITNATMQIAGAISTATAGSINATAGTIQLNGATTQSLSGSSFSVRSIRNVIASNSINVSSAANDSLKITGVLSFGNVNNKVFNSGDNIILASTAIGTAMVADITNNGANNSNSFAGNFQVQRYIPARRAWRLMTVPISSPLTINQAWQEGVGGTWATNPAPGYGTHITGGPTRNTTQGFDQGPLNPSIYGFGTSSFNYLPDSTGQLASGRQGWMLFVRGSRAINLPSSNPTTIADITTLRPTGTIKYGLQPTLTNAAGGYMAVGNPYPAPINFKNINRFGVLGGFGGNNAYYLWDPNLGGTYGVGAYVAFSWNSAGYYDKSIVTGTGSSTINSDGVIASSAAFLVNQSPGGTISIDENDKDTVIYQPSFQFRPLVSPSSLRVSLYAQEANNEKSITDGTLILFHPSSSNLVDNEEVIKANNVKENLAIVKEAKNISIEYRDNLQLNDTLFYRLWNLRGQQYSFEVALSNVALPPGCVAFLEDLYLHQKTILSYADTTQVDFEITADAASANPGRFRIVIAALVALPVTITSLKAYEINNLEIMTEWAVSNEQGIVQYEVQKSTDGINFYPIGNTRALGGNNTYQFIDKNAAEGNNFYKIKSIDNTGRIKYSQIVKVYKGKGKPAISVYPNPVTDGYVHLVLNNMPGGNYQVKMWDAGGKLVFSKLIIHAAGSSAETINIAESTAKGMYQLEVLQTDGKRDVFSVLVQ